MDPNLANLKKILSKDSSLRDAVDTNIIGAYISDIKFFQSLKESKSIFKECCMYLKYEYFNKNSYIFKAGEYGDKFYILLQGEAGVHIAIKSGDTVTIKEVLVYKDGGSFGELALIGDKPRAASIFTKADCHLAVLDKANYNRLLASIMRQKQNELVEFLQKQSLFKSLTKGSILKLSYCFEEKMVKKQQVICREGEKVEFFYLIREGELKISRKLKIDIINEDEPMTKGTFHLKKYFRHRADISISGKGEFLGINDIDSEFCSFTCICISDTAKILAISASDFKKRITNTDSLSIINDRKIIRDSIHENSIKSITKIIKERVASPYKRLFLAENLSNKQMKRTSLIGKNKEIEGMRVWSGTKNIRFDSTDDIDEDGQFNDHNMKVPELKNSDDKLNSFRVRSALQGSRKNLTIIRPISSFTVKDGQSKMHINRSITIDPSVAKIEPSMEGKSPRIKRKIGNQYRKISLLISQIEPFGRSRSQPKNVETESVVNIHTAKKNYLKNKNNPANWSFRGSLAKKSIKGNLN